jgi:hypothetical protein
MRADILAVLVAFVRQKLKCSLAEAQDLVDDWAKPVTAPEAAAFEQLFDASRAGAHAGRGGAAISALTTGMGTLAGLGVFELLDWAPHTLVGDNVATPGHRTSMLNTSVASMLGCAAAAGGAAAGREVLTKDNFRPGAKQGTVRDVLAQGPLWRSTCPENNGGGVDKGCGIPPSPALQHCGQVTNAASFREDSSAS